MSSGFVASYVVLWILVALQSVMLFVLLRELGRIFMRNSDSFQRDGIAVGQRLPNLIVESHAGKVPLTERLGSGYALIVIASPDCSVCPPVIELVEQWQERVPGLTGLVLLDSEGASSYAANGGVETVVSNPTDVAEQLLVRVTPFVYVASRDGTVLAKGLVNDGRQLERLMGSARDEAEKGGDVGGLVDEAVSFTP
jgi:hypothetical protein